MQGMQRREVYGGVSVPLMQKSHPYRELNPCREHRECRYMVMVGAHAGKHRECCYMGMGTKPLVQQGHPHWEHRECRYMGVVGPTKGTTQGM